MLCITVRGIGYGSQINLTYLTAYKHREQNQVVLFTTSLENKLLRKELPANAAKPATKAPTNPVVNINNTDDPPNGNSCAIL